MSSKMSWIDVFKFKESEGGVGSGRKTTGTKLVPKAPLLPKTFAPKEQPKPKVKVYNYGGHVYGTVESYFPTSGNLTPRKQPDGVGQGFNTKSWFYAAKPPNEQPNQVNEPAPAKVDPVKAEPTAEDEARQIILDNPEISAATLLNSLKAKGLTIVKELKQEADSSSSNLAVNRSTSDDLTAKKESTKRFAGNFKMLEFNARIRETSINDGIGPTKFECVLIEEGLGNFRDGYYYTKNAIASGVTLFEGKKMFADHPSSVEEQTRPERSVRDIGGHYENLRVMEKDGRAMLVGDLVVMGDPSYDWVRGLMRRAAALGSQFPDKQFIGLSINANGEADQMPIDQFLRETDVPAPALIKIKEAMESGVTVIRPVHKLTEAVSCDLVTEPGAGGKVIKVLE